MGSPFCAILFLPKKYELSALIIICLSGRNFSDFLYYVRRSPGPPNRQLLRPHIGNYEEQTLSREKPIKATAKIDRWYNYLSRENSSISGFTGAPA